MKIQITRRGIRAGANQISRTRAEFTERRCALLPEFLEPALLRYLMGHVAAAQLVVKSETDEESGEFGQTLFMPLNEPAWFVLHLLLNRPPLFQLIAELTGCRRPENFFGRIHCSLPGAGHQIDWHNDLGDHRLIGLWLNLSVGPWAGGLFQLREKDSPRPIFEVGGEAGQTRPGDALIFRIAPELEHRSTPVDAGSARTVGVGWFREQPDRQTFANNIFFPFNGDSASHRGEAAH
jgi:hypothetical protein